MTKDVFDEYGNYKYPDYANTQYTNYATTTGGVMMKMTIDEHKDCPLVEIKENEDGNSN